MRADNPIRNFDPQKVAHYEKENYVAYYQKDWLKLLRVSVGLVKETFALSLWQAIRGAYLVARAEIAFAPFPENDIAKAQAYMRRFYQMIKNIHHEDFDVARAAQLEVNWWNVHRKLFGNPENGELIEALLNLYAEAYDISSAKLQDAARLRAMGMLYSDQWVDAGKPENSSLLMHEEDALLQSYVALKEAIRQ